MMGRQTTGGNKNRWMKWLNERKENSKLTDTFLKDEKLYQLG